MASKQTCSYIMANLDCMSSYLSYPQPNACTCECMTYLTPPYHLCINAWSYECMFMAKHRRNIKETLIYHVENKKKNKQSDRDI